MFEGRYVEVAIGLPIHRLFHYGVPDSLRSEVAIGKRVLIPFGSRQLTGYVVGFLMLSKTKSLREISGIIDQEPVFTSQMLELTKWMSEYYLVSWGEALEAALPGGLKARKNAECGIRSPVASRQSPEANLARLASRAKRGEDGNAEFGIQSLPYRLQTLTQEQEDALTIIKENIDRRGTEVVLLQGVRGSGKSQVCLEAIAYTLRKGRKAIFLLPEIFLIPQVVAKFKSRFGDRIGVLHSKLSARQGYNEWRKISDGQVDIVVGVRSAIFAPLPDLGLIVIDQEHDTSYKQENKPRYHARDVARMRAEYEGVPLILVSAAPSVESYHSAKLGKYKFVRLPGRMNQRALPSIKIVDMRKEPNRDGGKAIFSQELREAIGDRLKAGGKVVLFLNKRGYASFVLCRECGLVIRCPNCNLTLSYHHATKELKCNHCSYRQKAPSVCPECGSSYFGYFGIGTQRVEQELKGFLPRARILRLDVDTASRKSPILDAFRAQKANILVGTQLVIKGMGFPANTLLGIVSADTTLNLPDFRASEHTFQLMGEAAGWVGRGSTPCEVILQTYLPDQYAITCACRSDYETFYREELSNREELSYPPFSYLVKVVLRGATQAQAMKSAQDLARMLEEERHQQGFDSITILGPIAAPIARIRRKFRWQLVLKGANSDQLHSLMRSILIKAHALLRMKTIHIDIDVDPIGIL
jgi:primosomal protein N' (replication factor Y)